MSEINDAKVQFKNDLVTAGLNVLEYIPERPTPPIVVMNSASPYIETSQFGEYTLSLELVLAAATATNKKATEMLDQLIEDVLVALEPLTYAKLTNVNQPYNWQVNNAEYLTANVYVQLAITI